MGHAQGRECEGILMTCVEKVCMYTCMCPYVYLKKRGGVGIDRKGPIRHEQKPGEVQVLTVMSRQRM